MGSKDYNWGKEMSNWAWPHCNDQRVTAKLKELQNLTSLGKGSPSLKQIRSVLTWGINVLPSMHCYRWAQWLLLKHTVWKVLSHLEDWLLIIKIVCADNLGNFVEFWLVKLENCSHRHTHSHSSITWSS